MARPDGRGGALGWQARFSRQPGMRFRIFGAGAEGGVPAIDFGCVPMPVVACYQPATLERLKMDKDELRLDVAEALGKATALICLQTALVAALKAREF
jgi:hypothetical protein